MTDIIQKNFHDLLYESANNKQENNFYLTNEKYNYLNKWREE